VKGAAEETMDVKCPRCREKVTIKVADAEKKKTARCSKGHDIPLAQAM